MLLVLADRANTKELQQSRTRWSEPKAAVFEELKDQGRWILGFLGLGGAESVAATTVLIRPGLARDY